MALRKREGSVLNMLVEDACVQLNLKQAVVYEVLELRKTDIN